MIRRVLMITETRGKGIESDPVRVVMIFFYEDTLEKICEYDPWKDNVTK